jgi:predicted enzyme related to lactoylglutathione lyase
VIQDPQGGYVLVWEPRSHIGAGLVNAPGALCWNELATPDMDASAAFYRDLFEWTVEPAEGFGMPYMMIKTKAGTTNGGIRQAQGPEPTYWLNYFGSEDAATHAAKSSELGGNQLLEPTDIGAGKIAIVQDPQGAVFGLYSGQFEP